MILSECGVSDFHRAWQYRFIFIHPLLYVCIYRYLYGNVKCVFQSIDGKRNIAPMCRGINLFLFYTKTKHAVHVLLQYEFYAK